MYHPANEVHQTDMFDNLSDTFLPAFGSMVSDSCQSGSDTVVGKISDLSQKLSNSVDIKPLNYVPIQLQGHNQSYSCLSDSGCMIPIIKQSVLETGSKPCMSSVDNLGPVKLRSAFGQSVLAHLVRLDVRLGCHSSESPFLPVTFAVVKDLTENVILPEATVKELSEYSKMCEINTVDVDTFVSENVNDSHLDQDSNDENKSHNETNGQTDDGPTVDITSDQDSTDSESIDTLPFVVTDQSKLSELISEQQNDHTLTNCMHQAKLGKGNYFFKSGALFHREKIADQWVEQLVLPQTRRKQVMHFAHRTLTGGHCRAQRTRARIKLHFTWPGIRKDVLNFVSQCKDCSLRIGLRRSDHVPITPIVRPTLPFVVAHADIIGPLDPPSSVGHKYCLTIVDACTRWCWCYPLRTVTSQAVCDCFLDLFQNTGVYKVIVMDNGSNFCSVLTTEFLKRLGVSPRFVAPYHAEANGLVERFNSSFKTVLHFAMREFGRSWHKAVPLLVWVLRESPNATTGVSPFLLQYGVHPHGVLSLLKDNWTGFENLPKSKTVEKYLSDLKETLEKTREFADKHAKRAQEQYAKFYNTKAVDKSFQIGEQVIVLEKDSASKTFARWQTGEICQKLSPYTYIVSMPNGSRRHLHANKLRKLVVPVTHIGIISESDAEFGEVLAVPVLPDKTGVTNLPSQRIDLSSLSHLSEEQKNALLQLLDEFEDCFRDTPGLCTVVQHEIHLTDDFKPRQTRAYRVPELLKAEIEKQISKLLELGFIEETDSPMTSGVVCVTKPDKSIRLCCDYRYLNKYTVADSTPMKLLSECVYKVAQAKFISICDAKSGFWQLLVRPEDRWKCAFVTHHGVWTWKRMPFGLRNAPATFVKAMRKVLFPIRDHSDAYIDDAYTISNSFSDHLEHLRAFLSVIKNAGLTLSLNKCKFAQTTTKFVGFLVGNGTIQPDPAKVEAVLHLSQPKTRTELRSVLGIFNFFRSHIPGYAEIAKPLTDALSSKKSQTHFLLGDEAKKAFELLKQLVCQAPVLVPPKYGEPFHLYTDSSLYTVGCCLAQVNELGDEHPIAYGSHKLTSTQSNWSTVEREAFAILWALNRYRDVIFGAHVVVKCDHDPIKYLLQNTTQSPKLTRWALSIQQFDIEIQHIKGAKNVVADGLSRI